MLILTQTQQFHHCEHYYGFRFLRTTSTIVTSILTKWKRKMAFSKNKFDFLHLHCVSENNISLPDLIEFFISVLHKRLWFIHIDDKSNHLVILFSNSQMALWACFHLSIFRLLFANVQIDLVETHYSPTRSWCASMNRYKWISIFYVALEHIKNFG